jgi:surface carbohydrate biosynthesis protein
MKRILISVDHKWRDLPGYVYLSMHLENLGCKVKIARNGLERYFVAGFKPDLVVVPHLFEKDKRELMQNLHRQGVSIVILPTEGIPTLSSYRKFASGVAIDLSCVSIHFVWNSVMAKILRLSKTLEQNTIKISGCPRFDFYKAPLNKSLIRRKDFFNKYNLNNNFPVITLATNFTQAQFHKKNKEFFLADSQKLGYKEVFEKNYGDINNVPTMDFKSRELVMKSFLKLVKDFKEVNFIIKPHPSEDHTFYHDFLKKHDNLLFGRTLIITNEYIWDILNITDIELSRSCTTAIESWILDIPTIELRLNRVEWYKSNEHASGSAICNSYKALKLQIKAYLKNSRPSKKIISKRKSFIKKWCYNIDGKRTKCVAQKINSFLYEKKQKKKIIFNLSDWIIYSIINLTDYLVIDLKVYGILNTLRSQRLDSLGREDKHIVNNDITFWKKKLKVALKNA